MKSILVTGANGFIGRALCEKLLLEGRQVVGATRGPEGAARLADGVRPAIIGAIGPETDWGAALNHIDAIVHLAARVHVRRESASHPLAAFRQVNAAGTERLARMAAGAGVRRFVYMSSIKVNGEGRAEPYTERDEPAPQDPYALSKYEGEQILGGLAQNTGMEIVVLRPPLVYGPGVGGNFLRLLDWVHRGLPLPLGSIKNRRSLIYLGNLVDAIVACIEHPKAAGQTFLVSDGEDTSTPELIRRLAQAMQQPVRLLPFPAALLRVAARISGKSAEVERLTGSLTINAARIRLESGWIPPYTMAQGLKATAAWYLSNEAT